VRLVGGCVSCTDQAIPEYFEQQNAKDIPGAHKISLISVGIGNGWFDPIAQYAAYYNYTVYPGNPYVGDTFFNETIKEQMYNSMYGAGNCLDQLNDCASSGINEICSAADNFCYQEVENVFDVVLNRDEYDMRELNPDPFPYSFFEDYLNTPHVQSAIGAYVNYSSSSGTVGTAFGTTGDDAREEGVVAAVQSLLKQGIYIMQYAGDADYNCNWLGGEVVSYEIDAPGYCDAGFTNITTSDGIVHGVVKQAGMARVYLK
jgi:carboxypeptidase C (cathepsin A)